MADAGNPRAGDEAGGPRHPQELRRDAPVTAESLWPPQPPQPPDRPRSVVLDTLPVPYSGPSSTMMGGSTRLPWIARSLIAGSAGGLAVHGARALLGVVQPPAPEVPDAAPALRVALCPLLALVHGALRRRSPEPAAAVGFAALVIAVNTAVAGVGHGLPRRPGQAAAAIAQQTLFVTSVAAVHEQVRRLGRGEWTLRLYD